MSRNLVKVRSSKKQPVGINDWCNKNMNNLESKLALYAAFIFLIFFEQ